MTDVTAILVAQHSVRLRERVRIPLVEWECFEKALDKEHVLKLAQQLGVSVPRTWALASMDELDRYAQEFEYPVVLKPRRSMRLTPGGWISGSVTYAHSLDDVKRSLAESGSHLPMVQERVPGQGCGGFFLFAHGTMKAAFFHKRLREKPPSGGVSVLRESIPVHPQMRDYAVSLLSALGWHGVAMVEFKLDVRDGKPKLMEINPRFWGSLQLAIDAGVDFPKLLYDLELDGDVEPVTGYTVGVRSRWLLGDLDHLMICLLKPHRKLNLPAGYPGRWRTLVDFLKLGQANTRYEICRRDDMSPFFLELKEYVKQPFRRRNGAKT
jgi:predicted ATP-grasp superfamily ATP-dependent carboligase